MILKRENKKIAKILIVETKGKIYYGGEFAKKENFVKNEFLKNNPRFSYESFVDEIGKNDFGGFMEKLTQKIKKL